MARIMYAEITALSNKNGYCSAGNSYFADLYEVAPETVSRWISKLNQSGYIQLETEWNETYQREERRIKVGGLDKKIKGGLTKRSKVALTKRSKGGKQKDQTPLDKKINHNSTSTNTTSNNNTRPHKENGVSFSDLNADQNKEKKVAPKKVLRPAMIEILEQKYFEPGWFQSLGMTEQGKELLHLTELAKMLAERSGVSVPDNDPDVICDGLSLMLEAMQGKAFKWERENFRTIGKLRFNFTSIIEKAKSKNNAKAKQPTSIEGAEDFITQLTREYNERQQAGTK